MTRVVERCPNCGVEHEPSHVGPCEVCGHELRHWCRRHGGEIGWLDGPECPLCAREAEARPAAPPPPPPRPPAPPPRPSRPPAERVRRRRPTIEMSPPRDRGVALREGMEEIAPHLATGAGLAIRAVRALFVLVRTVVLWAMLGAAGGVGYAFLEGGEAVWLAAFGLSVGAGVGLFLGVILALRSLFARSPPP